MEEPKPTIASGKTALDSKADDKKNPPSVEKDVGSAVGQQQQQAVVNNPITRKLNKILESRVENDKVIQNNNF